MDQMSGPNEWTDGPNGVSGCPYPRTDGVNDDDFEGEAGPGVALEELESLEEEEASRQMTCDEWAAKNGFTPGPAMSGHFSGWVAAGVREELGIAGSAAEAWEQNGGGKFDRKPSKGESAKEFARRMLKKNPNAFFYRHNVPGEDTWHGDWSEEEIANFVQVATTHGCGDKWGLFASHIPHRVVGSSRHTFIMHPPDVRGIQPRCARALHGRTLVLRGAFETDGAEPRYARVVPGRTLVGERRL